MTDTTQQIIDSLAKFSWNYYVDLHEPMGTNNLHPNTPLTISYSFLTSRPDYYSTEWLASKGVTDVNSFTVTPAQQAFFTQEQSVFNESIKAWGSVANITFNPANNGEIGQIAFADVALDPGLLGFTNSPKKVDAIGMEGDIFINETASLNKQLSAGQVGYLTIFHELGPL